MKTLLSRSRLLEILAEIHNLRVGVVGDFALDGYWHVDMTKAQISRETPLFNRPVVAESYSPGGAANVAWNLAALRPRRPAELGVEEWARANAVSFAGRVDPEADPSGETFEVVDAQDRVVGRAPRARVHAERLLHRAVHVFVRNARGQLLLQRRSPLKDVAPNAWDSAAAGHLAPGEGYDACARREVAEELGASLPLRAVRKFAACEDLGWEFIHLYEATAEGPFRFPPSEIRELRWWEPAEVRAALSERPADFAASFRHLWSRAA